MATRERAVDRGTDRGRQLVRQLGRELRVARQALGLSLRTVGAAAGVSATLVWRIEHGLAPSVGVVLLAQLFAIVGLDLTAKAYPGGSPLRDAPHSGLLAALRLRLHEMLRWGLEVPLPMPGDQRAWDAMVTGQGWRYGVEAETAPQDSQALGRRLELKLRVLLLPETRRSRAFLDAVDRGFLSAFPVNPRLALQRLAAGQDPGGSSVIVLRPVRPRAKGGVSGDATSDDRR